MFDKMNQFNFQYKNIFGERGNSLLKPAEGFWSGFLLAFFFNSTLAPIDYFL